MGPSAVIVDCPIPNRHLQMAFVEGNQEVQTFATKAAAHVRIRSSPLGLAPAFAEPVPPDLEAKLREFQRFFNEHRTHAGLQGRLPDSGGPASPINFASYRWQKHCRGLYQTPIAA